MGRAGALCIFDRHQKYIVDTGGVADRLTLRILTWLVLGLYFQDVCFCSLN